MKKLLMMIISILVSICFWRTPVQAAEIPEINTYDELFDYVYENLVLEQKNIKVIYAGNEFHSTKDVSKLAYDVMKKDTENAFDGTVAYLSFDKMTTGLAETDNGTLLKINIEWKYDFSSADEYTDDIVKHIITDNMTDQDKLNAIYDFISSNYTYDYSLKIHDFMHGNKMVCQGYSTMYKVLADKAMLQNTKVDCVFSETHSWNVVKFDNQNFWQQVDVTNNVQLTSNLPNDDMYIIKDSYILDNKNINFKSTEQGFFEKLFSI